MSKEQLQSQLADLTRQRDEARAEITTFCAEMARIFGKPLLRLNDVACLLGMQAGEISELREIITELLERQDDLCICDETTPRQCDACVQRAAINKRATEALNPAEPKL